MKVLFYVSCLLNVVFFFWELNKGALTPVSQAQQNLPRIVLFEELESARRSAAVSAYLDNDLQKLEHFQFLLPEEKLILKPLLAKSSASTIKHPPNCYEFGPFPDKHAVTAWMAAESFHGEVIDKSASTPTSYMVYFPTDKNAEQLRIQKMMLTAKGVKDFYVIPSGEFKGVISLGVFNDYLRAAKFKSQLLQSGVKADISERNKNESKLFARISTHKALQAPLAGMMPVSCKVNKK